jgi:hypothetical protein
MDRKVIAKSVGGGRQRKILRTSGSPFRAGVNSFNSFPNSCLGTPSAKLYFARAADDGSHRGPFLQHTLRLQIAGHDLPFGTSREWRMSKKMKESLATFSY